jgi:hypothetical protein
VQESFKISIIKGRCCRAFYGIVYDEPWNKAIHPKCDRRKNPDDGKYYVQRIHWLIEKHEFVKDDAPPKKTFYRSLNFKNRDKWISHKIVRFDGLRNRPDRPTEDSPARECTVQCNLGPAIRAQGTELEHVEVSRRKFLGANLGGRFYRVEYDIYVHVGPADLSFKLHFDGKERSGSEEVKVDWEKQYRMVAESVKSDDDDTEGESDPYD